MLSATGSSALPDLGRAVVGLDDLDGDLAPDFAAAGRGLPSTGGFVQAFSGLTGAVLWTVTGVSPVNQDLEFTLASLGDVNGDGRDDVGVGAWSTTLGVTGRFSVLSGSSGALLHSLHGLLAFDLFGASAAGLGDVDADGFADFVVCAPRTHVQSVGDGYARVFSGRFGMLLHHLALPAGGTVPSGFGVSVAGPGDVDGDGRGDIAVGAPQVVSPAPAATGVIAMFSGLTGQPLPTLVNPDFNEGFGTVIAAPGDLDGDLVGDLVSAPPAPASSGLGASLLAVRADGTLIWSFFPTASLPVLWSTLAVTPDVDGDSVTDLLVAETAGQVLPQLVSGAGGTLIGPAATGTPIAGTGSVYAGADGSGNGAAQYIEGNALAWNGVVLLRARDPVAQATVTVLGGGYPPAVPPQLSASSPLLGGTLTLNVTANIFSGAGTLVIAPGPENPLVIVPGLVVWPDISQVPGWILQPVNTDAGGQWTGSFTLPPLSFLEDSQWVLQAWLPFGTSLSTSLFTNGLILNLGYL